MNSKFNQYLEAINSTVMAFKSNKKPMKFTFKEWIKLKKMIESQDAEKAYDFYIKHFPNDKQKWMSTNKKDMISHTRHLVEESYNESVELGKNIEDSLRNIDEIIERFEELNQLVISLSDDSLENIDELENQRDETSSQIGRDEEIGRLRDFNEKLNKLVDNLDINGTINHLNTLNDFLNNVN